MLRPSLQTYLELPITVVHAWESYPVVDQALIELEQGQFQSAAWLAQSFQQDGRFKACLSTRLNALAGLPMSFKYQGEEGKETSGANADDKGDENTDSAEVLALKQQVAELVAKYWERMVPPDVLQKTMERGLLLNAGIGENCWSYDGAVVIPTLKEWDTQFVYWRWDTRSYWLNTADGPTELAPGDGRWVVYSPTGHNHGWLGGLVFSLAKVVTDRRFQWRDWARASEKYSLGVLLASVPTDGSKEDKARFERAVTNLPNETAVILPKDKEGFGFGLEMMKTDTAANWQSFKERMQELNTEIAITLLGQNLTTEISGGSGSRAAVGGHDKVRIDYLKGDVQSLSAALKRQVVAPFVRYNFEDQADALGVPWQDLIPDATWVIEEEEDAKDAAAAISSIGLAVQPLQAAGADVKKLLEKHGIPVVDGPVPPMPAPGAAVPRPRDGEQPEQPLNPGEPPEDVSADPRDQHENKRRRPALKAGARAGQVLADDVADKARTAAADALGTHREQLLRLVMTSKSYDELREGVLKLYRGWKTPKELRNIVEGAVMSAELIGRVSSHVDRK